MIRRRPVERRGDHLTLDRPLHIGHLFRPLIHQHHHQMALRIVPRDRIRDGLQHHRLTRLRRRHDQRPLTLTDRHHQIDHPRGQNVRLGLQPQPLLRVQRSQLVELRPPPRLLRVHPVDGVHAGEWPVPLSVAGLPGDAGHQAARPQAVLLELGRRHVDVVRSGGVPGRADQSVVVPHLDDAGDGDQKISCC